jgi:hypothetical protein
MKEATELAYLKWFRIYADFGPAHGDVVRYLDQQFEDATGTRVPENWRSEEGE